MSAPTDGDFECMLIELRFWQVLFNLPLSLLRCDTGLPTSRVAYDWQVVSISTCLQQMGVA